MSFAGDPDSINGAMAAGSLLKKPGLQPHFGQQLPRLINASRLALACIPLRQHLWPSPGRLAELCGARAPLQ